MGRRLPVMVLDKGILTWRPMFSYYAVLFLACFFFTCLDMDTHSVVARGTTDSSKVEVKSHEKSLEDCAQACAKEKRIQCDEFKYKKSSGACLMISNKNNKNQASKSNKKTKTSGDTANVEDLRHQVMDLQGQLQVLQQSKDSDSRRSWGSMQALERAYSRMSQKLSGIKGEGDSSKSTMRELSTSQQLLAKQLSGMKEEQHDLFFKLSELTKTATDMSGMATSLRATDGDLQRQIEVITDSTNALTASFEQLRTKVGRELSVKQMPPGMVKLKHNQGTIATALENVLNKVSSLAGRLPQVEEKLKGTDQKVVNQAGYQRDLQAKVKDFYKNLLEIKKAVHDLLDSRSPLNVDRNQKVLKLRADLSMLAELDKGLKNDVSYQKQDLAGLIKEVAKVQISAQTLKNNLGLVLMASQQFKQDIGDLKRNQKKAVSVVEVAQMHKQVLTTVTRLKLREAILLKNLNLYRTAIKKLATRVYKNADQRSTTQDSVTRMRSRLNRLEKQIQLLFDETTNLIERLRKPPTPKVLKELSRTQGETGDQVKDILKQLQTLRRRISVLSVDLRQTRVESEQEKMLLKKGTKEREKEMDRKEKELEKQAKEDKKEIANAMKMRKKQLEKQKQAEERRMEKELQAEQKKRKKEEEKNKKLLERQSKMKKAKLDKINVNIKQTLAKTEESKNELDEIAGQGKSKSENEADDIADLAKTENELDKISLEEESVTDLDKINGQGQDKPGGAQQKKLDFKHKVKSVSSKNPKTEQQQITLKETTKRGRTTNVAPKAKKKALNIPKENQTPRLKPFNLPAKKTRTTPLKSSNIPKKKHTTRLKFPNKAHAAPSKAAHTAPKRKPATGLKTTPKRKPATGLKATPKRKPATGLKTVPKRKPATGLKTKTFPKRKPATGLKTTPKKKPAKRFNKGKKGKKGRKSQKRKGKKGRKSRKRKKNGPKRRGKGKKRKG